MAPTPAPPLLRRPRFILAALLLVAALHAVDAAPANSGWRASTGREKITPSEPLWMTGYAVRTHPAEGTRQDLWVKALAVEDPSGARGVLITADLCGITRAVSDAVAAELGRRFGVPRSAIMTNASHTHCSPWLEGHLTGLRLYSPEDQVRLARYRKFVETQMISAGARALESLAPATLSWSEDEATFGINRRNNSAAQLPALSAAGKLRGPSDPRVPVLAIKDVTNRLVGLLVSYACHNTTLTLYEWHGDYAGSAQVELERRHPGATVLFASGCGADINPFPRGEVAHADAHGRALADAADRALAKPVRSIEGRFTSAWSDIELTFARKPSDEELRQAREQDRPYKEMYQAWADVVARDLRSRGDDALKYAYPIQAWRLGSLAWVALAGEPVVDYSLRLRREFDGSLWVLGYATDVMAYIPSERVLAEGRYEGDTSMVVYGKPSKWSPGLEERIVAKTHELLRLTAAPK